MTDARRILMIVNPRSGGGRAERVASTARRFLETEGVAVDVAPTRSPQETLAMAREAVELGDPLALVCGGDGTVHTAANALAHTDTTLGVIPAGRANDLARALDIPFNTRRAARLVGRYARGEAEARQIDLGRANGVLFCTVAAFGVDAEISRRTVDSRSNAFAYVAAAISEAWRYRPIRATISGDFGERYLDVTLCATANTPVYGGRFRIAPDAEPDDGLFHVCLIRGMSRVRTLRLMRHVLTGSHVYNSHVETLTTAELRIDTEAPSMIYADGEPIAETPVSFAVERGALRVLGAKAHVASS